MSTLQITLLCGNKTGNEKKWERKAGAGLGVISLSISHLNEPKTRQWLISGTFCVPCVHIFAVVYIYLSSYRWSSVCGRLYSINLWSRHNRSLFSAELGWHGL